MEEYLKYKNYPEGSGLKKLYDSKTLSVKDFLLKYYSACDMGQWNRWMSKYVKPAYDKKRYDEMVRNFGYVSIKKHEFKTQYKFYELAKDDDRLDIDVAMFIGFLAGTGFFDNWALTLEEWFNIPNWSNPHNKFTESNSINTLLKYPYGLDCFRLGLLEMPHWKR